MTLGRRRNWTPSLLRICSLGQSFFRPSLRPAICYATLQNDKQSLKQSCFSRLIITPNLACLLEEALASALTIEAGFDRYVALRAVATAQQQAQRPTVTTATLAAAIAALDDAGSAARSLALKGSVGGSRAFRSICLAQLELSLTTESRARWQRRYGQRSPRRVWRRVAHRAVGEAQTQAGLNTESAVSCAQALEIMRSLDDTGLRANEPRRRTKPQLQALMADAVIALNQALDVEPQDVVLG